MLASRRRLAGFFTYDADVPQFTNFHVMWNGADFDLTHDANTLDGHGRCGEAAAGAELGFRIVSGTTACPADQLWHAFSSGGTAHSFYLFASARPDGGDISVAIFGGLPTAVPAGRGDGTFTIAPTATVPEPTLLVLLGTGLLGAVLARRRRVQSRL